MAHVHAELMKQYAEDAAETDKPWDRWQINFGQGWGLLTCHPMWGSNIKYRRKPRTININGLEVPEPLREVPKDGTKVYFPLVDTIELSDYSHWSGTSFDNRILERGTGHLTQEAAETHAQALLSFTEAK